MNYEWSELKKWANDQGYKIKDLVALAAQNDPFAVDTEAQREKAEWFAEQWVRLGYTSGVHVRRCHYQILSIGATKPDGTPYENTDNDWGLTKLASKYARYLRLVPMDGFVDMKNPKPVENLLYSDLADPTPELSVYSDSDLDFWGYDIPEIPELPELPYDLPSLPDYEVSGYTDIRQEFHCEVWAEKTGMNSELLPLSERYKFNLITGAGDLSISAVRDFMERVRVSGLPGRILYVSDLDPQGFAMPAGVARKIEWFYRTQGYGDLDIRLLPIVLTAEQAQTYNLPVAPSKQQKPQTELDSLEALHPGEFARIVTEEVLKYHAPGLQTEAWAVKRDLRQALREEQEARLGPFQDRLDAVNGAYAKVLENFEETRDRFTDLVKGFQSELDAYKDGLAEIVANAKTLYSEIHTDLEETDIDPEYEFPLPEADLPVESDDLLYDSDREFMDQMKHYNDRKAEAKVIFDKERLNGKK